MKTLAQCAVGETVTLDGFSFFVLYQGSPGSDYQGFDHATTLLRNGSCGVSPWLSSGYNISAYDQNYANSNIRDFLNSCFLPMLSPETQAQLLTVRIPYKTGESTYGLGANGLESKLWIPALAEISLGSLTQDGGFLDFWRSGDGVLNGLNLLSVKNWWTRSSARNSADYARYNGQFVQRTGTIAMDVVPILALPDTLKVDAGGSVLTARTVQTPVRQNGAWHDGTPWLKANGTWKEAEHVSAKIGGTWCGQ